MSGPLSRGSMRHISSSRIPPLAARRREERSPQLAGAALDVTGGSATSVVLPSSPYGRIRPWRRLSAHPHSLRGERARLREMQAERSFGFFRSDGMDLSWTPRAASWRSRRGARIRRAISERPRYRRRRSTASRCLGRGSTSGRASARGSRSRVLRGARGNHARGCAGGQSRRRALRGCAGAARRAGT